MWTTPHIAYQDSLSNEEFISASMKIKILLLCLFLTHGLLKLWPHAVSQTIFGGTFGYKAHMEKDWWWNEV